MMSIYLIKASLFMFSIHTFYSVSRVGENSFGPYFTIHVLFIAEILGELVISLGEFC